MKKDNKLQFENYGQASEWFDKIDLTEYEDHLIPASFSFDLRKNRDLVELDREIATTVRKLARKQNVPTKKLVNRLLREGLEGLI
jgi:hypothetical protein